MKTYKITRGNKQYVIKAKDTYSAVTKLQTFLKDQKQVAKFTKSNNGDVAEGFIMETSKGYTFTSPQNPKDDKDFSTQKLAENHANKLGYIKDNKSVKDSDKDNEQERNKKIQQLANKTGLSFASAKRMLEEIESGNDSDYEEMSEMLRDDRLSPMTYKKLKEMGYNSDKWKNLTQEQANKIVQSNATSNSNSGNKSTSTKPSRQQQIIENNKQKARKLSDISHEVVKDIKRFISKESTKDPRAIVRYIRNTAIIAAEKNKTNVCEGSDGEKYKFNVTDRSNYSQAFKMALGGVPVTVNGRIARVKFVTPDEYLAQSAKQKGISTSELLTNTDDEVYQNVLSGLKKDKTLSSGIYMDYSNKSQEGNRRVRALKELGVTSIPVLYVGRKWDKEKDSALLHY